MCDFSWQVQHLVKFMSDFLWQVQHLVKFMCDFSWQMQHLVKFMWHFLWQAQYLVKFMCHFSWQVQHLVKFMCNFLWQAWHLVKFMCHFSWQVQHLVKCGMIAGAGNVVIFKNLLLGSAKSSLGGAAGCGLRFHGRIILGSFSDRSRIVEMRLQPFSLNISQIWECNFVWQAQYLMKFRCHFCGRCSIW